jgi:OmpA-OmpF porin, OOP family
MLMLSSAACSHRAAPGTIPGRISVDFASGRITLMGMLPSEESRARLLARAREIYGATRVSDMITVDPKVIDDSWIGGDQLFLPLIDAPIEDGQSAFDGKTLLMTGNVANAVIRNHIADNAAKTAGSGILIENHLQVDK